MEISQLSLKRLFSRAGIKRVSSNSYNQLYHLIQDITLNILDKSSTLVKSRQNNILSQDEIKNGFVLTSILDIINNQIQDGGEDSGWCDNEPSQCGNSVDLGKIGQTGGVAYCDGNLSQCGNFSEEAISTCKINQSGSGVYFFSIPTTQYHRFINDLISKNYKNLKITKSGLKELQYSVETRAIEYISKLNSESEKKVFQF